MHSSSQSPHARRARAERRARWPAVACLLAAAGAACGPISAQGPEAAWDPLAKKWFDRANESYRHADISDAEVSIENAMRIAPELEEVRLLGARIALAQLDYARAIELLGQLGTLEARQLRARAYWYDGQIQKAADELEVLLADPNVRDEWAGEISKLARRGSGRTPFQLRGLLGYGEMPRLAANDPSLVIPVEVGGEQALGLVHTGFPETVIDGSGEPQWISLRFGSADYRPGASQLEVKDVPALTKDLSGLSRRLNAPIKVLLGVNLLRHIYPTFDLMGSQFVVRSFEPPPPPAATTVRLNYLRGGGMVLRSPLGPAEDSPVVALFVDTSMTFPVAFSNLGWKKAGVPLNSLQLVPNTPNLKQGTVPYLQVGAFQFPDVTAVHLTEMEQDLEIELDGQVGSGLLAAFRVTLFDGGRAMWLEDQPAEALGQPPADADGPDGPPPAPPGEGDETAPDEAGEVPDAP